MIGARDSRLVPSDQRSTINHQPTINRLGHRTSDIGHRHKRFGARGSGFGSSVSRLPDSPIPRFPDSPTHRFTDPPIPLSTINRPRLHHRDSRLVPAMRTSDIGNRTSAQAVRVSRFGVRLLRLPSPRFTDSPIHRFPDSPTHRFTDPPIPLSTINRPRLHHREAQRTQSFFNVLNPNRKPSPVSPLPSPDSPIRPPRTPNSH